MEEKVREIVTQGEHLKTEMNVAIEAEKDK